MSQEIRGIQYFAVTLMTCRALPKSRVSSAYSIEHSSVNVGPLSPVAHTMILNQRTGGRDSADLVAQLHPELGEPVGAACAGVDAPVAVSFDSE